VQSWSERASADSAYNAGLRKRLLHPLEFPILATSAPRRSSTRSPASC